MKHIRLISSEGNIPAVYTEICQIVEVGAQS